jgi:lipopolysaccharide export system protein LptA
MNKPPTSLSFRYFPALASILVLAAVAIKEAHGQAGETTPQSTIITSERAELRNTGIDAYTVFEENVRLTGTNLEVTCDKLEVFGEQVEDPEKQAGTLGKIRPRRILATGHVVILQAGRKATAETLEVLPQEDKIILSGNPVVTDTQGTAAGDRITLLRGDQRLYIDNPRIEMRSLPNLGFPQNPDNAPEPEPGAEPQPETTTEPPAQPTTPDNE